MRTVNSCYCRKFHRFNVPASSIFRAAALLLLPVHAYAQLTGSATATSQYSGTSNIFAADTAGGTAAENGAARSATSLTYGASADGRYQWSRQQFYVTANFTQSDYRQQLDLNHYEYTLDTGLKWQLGEILDGGLDVSRTRAMVPFLDLTGSVISQNLSLLTGQTETMQVGVKLDSEWKLLGSVSHTESTQSSVGIANQELRQTSGTASLEYAGFGPFTSGLTATYTSGDASGADVARNPPFAQYTAGLLAIYKFSRTSFDGQVTYTRRTYSDEALDTVSGLTGSIAFNDQLTPKTGITVNITRAINVQYLNLGSEVDTSASLGLTWQATYKIGVTVGYMFNYRDFPIQSGGDTIDHEQVASLAISYHPVRWLSIATYGDYQTRSSNAAGRNFDSTQYGVSISATVGNEGTK